MASALPPFPSFDPSPTLGAPGVRWKKYVGRFRNLIVALNITDENRQKALLMHFAGEEVNDILEVLPEAEASKDEDSLEKAIDALTNYFQPRQNLAFEEYHFRQAKQESDEDLMTFYTRLKQLSLTCQFGDPEREIKSQIILKGSSSKLRRKALSCPDMKLEEILREGKAMELAEQQARVVEKLAGSERHNVNKFRCGQRNNRRPGAYRGKDDIQSRKDSKLTCRNCNRSYPHKGGRTSCPAYGKECRKCGKMNHFQSVCRSGEQKGKSKDSSGERHYKVRYVDEDSASDDSASDEHFLFKITVHSVKQNDAKHPLFNVKVNGSRLTVMADSGSSINILDEQDYRRIQPCPTLKNISISVYAYNSKSRLPVFGKFVAEITMRGQK